MIGLVSRFWIRVAAWAAAIALVLVLITLLSGAGLAELAVQLPAWLGLAATIAAFPAGVAVTPLVFRERLFVRAAVLAAAALVVCAVVFLLGNQLGPRFARATAPAYALVSGDPEPSLMSLGELRAEANAAVASARSATGEEAVRRWQRANHLVWHVVRRTDGTALPLLFGLLGVLTGFWSRWSGRRDVQMAQQWAMGLFLLVSTYLVGENSYEMIVLRSAGPVFFAGDLVLVVPAMLSLGLGWPVLMVTRRGREDHSLWPA